MLNHGRRTLAVPPRYQFDERFQDHAAVLPELVAQKWGRVINIASTAGKVGFQYTAAYCASKHGVVGFTRALALEMATLGVTVNAICPGFVNTDMAREAARNIAAKTGGSEEEAEKVALEAFASEPPHGAGRGRRGRRHAGGGRIAWD